MTDSPENRTECGWEELYFPRGRNDDATVLAAPLIQSLSCFLSIVTGGYIFLQLFPTLFRHLVVTRLESLLPFLLLLPFSPPGDQQGFLSKPLHWGAKKELGPSATFLCSKLLLIVRQRPRCIMGGQVVETSLSHSSTFLR